MTVADELRREERLHREWFLPFYATHGFTIETDHVGDGHHPFDVEITDQEGSTWRIDEKAHKGDYPFMLIELIQDTRSGSPGWFTSTTADFILDAMFDGDRVTARWVNMGRLRACEWADRPLRVGVDRDGYGLTLYVLVPWKTLEATGIAVRAFG